MARISDRCDVSRRAAGAVLGLFVMVASAGAALSQAPKDEKKENKQDDKSVPVMDEWKQAMKDEVDIATVRVAAKRAEVRLAKNRLARVREVVASVDKRYKQGYLPDSSMVVGKLDVEEAEAVLEIRESELKEREIRLAALQRAAGYGASTASATAAAMRDDLQTRLDAAERRIEELEEHNRKVNRSRYAQ